MWCRPMVDTYGADRCIARHLKNDVKMYVFLMRYKMDIRKYVTVTEEIKWQELRAE